MVSMYLDSRGCDDNKVSISTVGKIAGKVILISLLIGSSSMPAFAIEPVKAVSMKLLLLARHLLLLLVLFVQQLVAYVPKRPEKQFKQIQDLAPLLDALLSCLGVLLRLRHFSEESFVKFL
jgi:hypothetical protein